MILYSKQVRKYSPNFSTLSTNSIVLLVDNSFRNLYFFAKHHDNDILPTCFCFFQLLIIYISIFQFPLSIFPILLLYLKPLFNQFLNYCLRHLIALLVQPLFCFLSQVGFFQRKYPFSWMLFLPFLSAFLLSLLLFCF